MALESDVVVIGGGLAGSTAALAAARTGAGVRLVSHKQSTLQSASGLIDVLGYVDGHGPVIDPFAHLGDLPEEHPYTVVGEAGLREGLALFDDVAGEEYRGDHTDRNALVPTQGGTVKPTARYPTATAPGLASDDAETLLIGFESLPAFDGPLAAAHLEAAGVSFDVAGATVAFPGEYETDARVTRLAAALDDDEDRVRDRLAERVNACLGDAERVGFPALLGAEATEAVRAELADRLGARVFEVPGGPPSLPGLRLADRLTTALRDAGVEMETGNPVVDYDGAEGRVDRVVVDRNGAQVPVTADQFVLATGGLVGKGLDSDREVVSEPLFDCHVPHPRDRYDWSAPDAFGDHPFARFGVVPDEELRPTDPGGSPEYANLRAAGAVIGGADVAAECSASGVSLATGAVAGRLAGETP